jgi:hypothetical protein
LVSSNAPYEASNGTCAAARINRFTGTLSSEPELAAIGNKFLTFEQKRLDAGNPLRHFFNP